MLEIFLLIFKAAKRKNYGIEALTLLVQYYAKMSPRQRQQLLWSRFVNTQGKPGGNKPCDQHNEHLNRTIKAAIGGQGSNLKPKAILRIGKCAGPLDAVCQQFDTVSCVIKLSGKHSGASRNEDLKKIVEKLQAANVFQKVAGRKHSKFPNMRGSIVNRIDIDKFEAWMKKQLIELSM